MKLVPDAIGRKIASQGLLASEHAPKALFVGGVIGMVGSTVLACRATLKISDTLDAIEVEKNQHIQAKEDVDSGKIQNVTYPEKEYRRDLALVGIHGVGKIVRLYAPSVILGGISIAALTKSHNLLQDRNLALTAAYAAVDGAFNRYRQRVIDRYGEDADRELVYETEEVEIIDENGKTVSTTQVIDAPGSKYARFYDELSSSHWSPDPDINLMSLRQVQTFMNERLRARGHVFLNEVYRELGLSHTKAGAVVGWRWGKDSGDDYIDFGIWNGENESVNDFFHGREGALLLDFNVDGVIYDKLDEDGI